MGRHNFYGMKAGDFVAYKRPADVGAPYSAAIVLPDGRQYEGRLRSHPMREGHAFWYEGFVVALEPIVYARDEDLKRYPVAPVLEPKQWNLLPCQLKLNPYPSGYENYLRTDLIGEMWVSGTAGATASQLYTIRADYRDGDIAFEGTVEPYGSRTGYLFDTAKG